MWRKRRQEALMEWISVKDRLPSNANRVLICDEYGWIWTGSYEWYDLGYRWETTAGDEPGCTITHWMPLPALPEDKNGMV
jgi:hypothetical protein